MSTTFHYLSWLNEQSGAPYFATAYTAYLQFQELLAPPSSPTYASQLSLHTPSHWAHFQQALLAITQRDGLVSQEPWWEALFFCSPTTSPDILPRSLHLSTAQRSYLPQPFEHHTCRLLGRAVTPLALNDISGQQFAFSPTTAHLSQLYLLCLAGQSLASLRLTQLTSQLVDTAATHPSAHGLHDLALYAADRLLRLGLLAEYQQALPHHEPRTHALALGAVHQLSQQLGQRRDLVRLNALWHLLQQRQQIPELPPPSFYLSESIRVFRDQL